MEYDDYIIWNMMGWWFQPLRKKILVSWDDDIHNIWKHIKCSKPPTRYNMEYDVWYSKYHLYYDDYTMIFTSVKYIYI